MPKHNRHPAQVAYLLARVALDCATEVLAPLDAHFDEGFDLFDGSATEYGVIYRAKYPRRAELLDAALKEQNEARQDLHKAEIELVRWSLAEARKVATTQEEIGALDACNRMIEAPHRYPTIWARAVDNATRLAA